jgi:DNA-binding transcriptional regulator YiaG
MTKQELAMRRCAKCKGLMERSIRPEHIEDLGGVVVNVLNAVQVYRCGKCDGEIVAIPDMDGLARATAISRALDPVILSGREVKFMRRVLDMTQAEFAKTIDLAPETVSRWEHDEDGRGGASEKLLRHNVCALLYKETKGRPYDPAVIAHMQFTALPEGKILPPLRMVRVRVQDDDPHADSWGEMAGAA